MICDEERADPTKPTGGPEGTVEEKERGKKMSHKDGCGCDAEGRLPS